MMTSNNTNQYTNYPDIRPAIMEKRSNTFKYPLISGVIIGVIGGTIGTLIYNLLKGSKIYSKLNFVFDFTLKAINLSYKLPVYGVIILILVALTGIFFYNRNSSK
jgi:H+/Cl- antiporter ClcA